MHYQTFEPHKDLAACIRCYWTLESPAENPPKRQTIVPDGCMEMIFHYGDLYRQYTENGSLIQPRCFVFGQLSQPLEIEPTGATGIFSVRFNPDGFLPFATMPVKDMENRAVPLHDLFHEDGETLGQNILLTGSVTERISLTESFLSARLKRTETIDRIVQSTVDTIMTANGQLPVGKISEQMHVHRRNLERRFEVAIGLSPKQLSRIVRMQAALKMLLNRQFSSLTTLAAEGEYYDQSHFIKDFKEFTGCTPGEFYGDNLKMSALFLSK